MRKPFAALTLALALAVATAGVAAWAGNVSRPLGVPIASHDGTVITPPGGSQPTTAAALGEITTTEGTWTFGTPGDANGDYPLLLNGSAAGGGLAAVSAQVTNGNLYAFTKASRHYWCRFNRAWVDVGAMAPAEGTVATKVTLNHAHARTPDNAPAGTVLATVEVTMSPPGAPFLGALVSSNPLFTFRGMNVVLARAYTRADNGKIYTARITALAQ